MRFWIGLFIGLISASTAHAQGYQCRTSPNGASTAYCASEAFITQHFPSSSTAGHVATFADGTGQVLQDGGAGVGTVSSIATGQGLSGGPITTTGTLTTSPGVDTNTLVTVSGAVTIASGSGYCGKALSWSGAANTITLNAVAGFASDCSVEVCNSNANDSSHHAATLSGFPSPSLAHLWMGQCQTVAIVNGGWQVKKFPGKFLPGFVVTCFYDTGGINANDSLVSNASTSAVRDPQQCLNIWQDEMDLGSQQPFIAGTCNQINNQDGGAGAFLYALRPTRVIFFINNGACGGNNPILRNTGGNVVTELSDFGGYVIFDGITVDCTGAASHPCFGTFVHQQNGVDLSTAGFTIGVTYVGAAATDVAFWCDSKCKVNTGAAVTLAGSFNNGLQLDKTSVFDVNAGMVLADGLSISKNMVQADSGTQFQWSGALTSLGTATINQVFGGFNGGTIRLANNFTTSGTITGARQWAILNNGLFCNASATAVPGSAGINTSAGWAAGIIAAATSGACFP